MPIEVAIDTSRISTQPLFARSQRHMSTQTTAMMVPPGTLNAGGPGSRVGGSAVFARRRNIGRATQVLAKTNSLVMTVNFNAVMKVPGRANIKIATAETMMET